MSKASIILIGCTLLVFGGALLFLPDEMVSHINSNGISTNFSNKYVMFLTFILVDVIGSFFWNLVIHNLQKLAFFPTFKARLKNYFAYLMLTLLFMILVAPHSSAFPISIFAGSQLLFLVYLFRPEKL